MISSFQALKHNEEFNQIGEHSWKILPQCPTWFPPTLLHHQLQKVLFRPHHCPDQRKQHLHQYQVNWHVWKEEKVDLDGTSTTYSKWKFQRELPRLFKIRNLYHTNKDSGFMGTLYNYAYGSKNFKPYKRTSHLIMKNKLPQCPHYQKITSALQSTSLIYNQDLGMFMHSPTSTGTYKADHRTSWNLSTEDHTMQGIAWPVAHENFFIFWGVNT